MVTSIENLEEIGDAIYEIMRTDGQTDRQTDRQTR